MCLAKSQQLILGTSNRKDIFFEVYETDNKEQLEVYFGMALLEKVEKGRDSLQLKLLIARLYNMKYKRKNLVEAFGFDRKTIAGWGDALKQGDLDRIQRVFAGHQNRRKLTSQIESYARSRFREIYQEDRYTYSKKVRDEISEHFDVKLSAESLRPIFTEEKEKYRPKNSGNLSAKKDKNCDLNADLSGTASDNRKQVTLRSEPECYRHHVGILLLMTVLKTLTEGHKSARLTLQWLCSTLLGAVNIEQSCRLDFRTLAYLLKIEPLTTPRHQRNALKVCGVPANQVELLRRNAILAEADNQQWFYYDPHGIAYTGIRKILKGWCGGCGKIVRVNYQDFIHTPQGYPVFFKHYDNYYDLRERFHTTISEFGQILENSARPLAFVVDRGIYGKKTLSEIHQRGDIIITWEKGYRKNGWDDTLKKHSFILTRYRNNSRDSMISRFTCIRYTYDKLSGFDRVIVRARSRSKGDIEVSILTNASAWETEKIVTAMFSRWVQENDFLFEIRHFGLNQITSYDYESYDGLSEVLIDKAIDSDQYIVNRIEKNKVEASLKKLLLKKEKADDKGKKLTDKDQTEMALLKQELAELEVCAKEIKRKCGKLDKLIANGAQRLKTEPKQYMDAVRITARNAYFDIFKKFRPHYDNYRNDHMILQTLIKSGGYVSEQNGKFTVNLLPALNLQPKQTETVRQFLQMISCDQYQFQLWEEPDKSG